jgi:tRNA threonylcarbamoyladenosine biosynthesis protein TsaB
MRILVLDAALSHCLASLVVDGSATATRETAPGASNYAAELPAMAEAVLAAAGLQARDLTAVGVTVGPGSFTGLRAALALAHGIGSSVARPVIGVSVAEALRQALVGTLRGRQAWVAIDSRRKRVFLDRGDRMAAVSLEALPAVFGRVALAGDAALEVAVRMAARGDDVMLTDARRPGAEAVATIAVLRLHGDLAPLPAQPMYVDPPEAKLPAGGLRPPPATAQTPAERRPGEAAASLHRPTP